MWMYPPEFFNKDAKNTEKGQILQQMLLGKLDSCL
jgi:hypothetical protein